jgi:serine/threonine-protein kinase
LAVGAIGKYERLDVLGHGTSGVVYLAWDTLLRRQVALKEIRAAGPEMERVLEEARVLDRLGRHPHIVHVNSVDSQGGVILIDMELVRGRNLAEALRERNGEPLPVEEAVRITRAVLDALAFAHEKRIVHRDVKPANILIGDDGTVKLTDFGLAEALGTGSVAGGGGTYPYMAPEDFAEDAASDYRSDLWAVGVVLYEMLTGRRPFQVSGRRTDPFAWKRAIEQDNPPPLTALRPELPGALDAMLRRALAKDKAARFASAVAFGKELEIACANARSASAAGASVPLDRIPAGPHPADATIAVLVMDPEPDAPFVFSGGAVARTLDELLYGAARHWDEARRALLEGRVERFLRAIGEPYIADLAAELRARGGSGDQLLREFLERSRGAVEEEADPGTVPAGSNPLATALRRRPRRVLLRRPAETDEATAPAVRLTPPPVLATAPTPQPTPPGPAGTRSSGTLAVGWWFWPLWLFCLGPLATALASHGHMEPGQMGQYNDVFEGWAVSGVLGAMLLLVGIGARFPLFARVACAVPVAGGLVAAGALVSQALGPQPTPDAVVRVAAVLLLPLAIFLIQAATAQMLWRLWGWVVLIGAFLGTLHFAR